MTARYFVTGAQGFVGRFFVARLLEEPGDIEVLGIGRSPADESCFTHSVHWGSRAIPAELPAGLAFVCDERYRYESADLRDRPNIEALLREFRPDVIVHLAAGLRDDSIEHLFRTNVEGTAHLIEAVVAQGIAIRRFVFGSSGAIYGRSAIRTRPLEEETPCLPADPYSVSKLASEHISRILTEQYRIPAVWARIFNILGPGQDERHFCGRVAAQVAAIRFGIIPPRIEVGDLSPTRDFIDVRDVAASLALLSRHGEPGSAYNVASGVETEMGTVLELAIDIAGLTGSVALDSTYRRSGDIARAYADISRLTRLGFTPHYELRQSMSDLVDYYCTTVRRTAERV